MVVIFTRQDAYLAEIHSKIAQLHIGKRIELENVQKHKAQIAEALRRHEQLNREEHKLLREAADVHPSTVKRAEGLQHSWYTPQCADDCPGCQWCAGGLEVCKVCSAFEGATPTHCPGFQPNSGVMDQIYGGELDYRFGKWIHRPSRYSPEFWRMIGRRLKWRGYDQEAQS